VDETLPPPPSQAQPDERRRRPDERAPPGAQGSGPVLALVRTGGDAMKRNRGFTLLELLIVITIVAILAAVAISAYSEQVRKAKRSEAMKTISELQLQMEKYRASCPSYENDTSGTNNCKDRNNDGDGADAGVDAAYPTVTDIASNNYTYVIDNQTPTSYRIRALKKASFVDPKCGTYELTYTAGESLKAIISSNETPEYCWP
jgi:type IV pilus assembly protein PilE